MDNIVDLGARFGKSIPIIEKKPEAPTFADGTDDDFPVHEFTYMSNGNVASEIVAGHLFFLPNMVGCHLGTDQEGNMNFNFIVPIPLLISIKQVELLDE